MLSIEWPNDRFVIDLETTGLDPARHGILEGAVMHLRSGQQRVWFVDPGPVEFDPEALRVNGTTLEDLAEPRVSVGVFAFQLMCWVLPQSPRAVMVGKNPTFDAAFLDRAAEMLGPAARALFRNMWHHRKIDVHSAAQALADAHGWDTSSGKIDDIYQRFGIDPEEQPHTAAGGVDHCQRCYAAVVQKMRTAYPHEFRRVEEVVP